MTKDKTFLTRMTREYKQGGKNMQATRTKEIKIPTIKEVRDSIKVIKRDRKNSKL